MLSHTVTKRVRYAETDQMGYLYYGNYALYYEIGRVELLRSLGITYKSIESDWGIIMPVVEMQIKYRRPAYYDELIEIRTHTSDPPEREIVFDSELYNEAGKLINTGRVVLCFVRTADRQRIPCPETLLELIQPHFA